MPRRHASLLSLTLLAVALGACTSVLGLDERPPRGAGGAGGSGGSSPACESVCDQDVPEGWLGPSVVDTGEMALSCDGAEPMLALFADPIAPPAACECACGAAVDIDCTASAITVTSYPNDTCSGSAEYSDTGVVGECLSLCCGGQFSASYTSPVPDVSAASCPPMTVTDEKAPLTWARHLVGCGPVTSSPCTGGECFDLPAEGALCIHRPGDVDCPAGPFSEASLWFEGALDTRGCEPCGCGGVEAQCNEVVVAHSNNSCSNSSGTLVADGCAEPSPDLDSAQFVSVAPTGSCQPNGGVAIGDVTPTEPTTVCCVP